MSDCSILFLKFSKVSLREKKEGKFFYKTLDILVAIVFSRDFRIIAVIQVKSMPKGISIIRWNNQLGPYLEIGYPDKILLSSQQITQIYTSQTMGDIATPRFTVLSTEELKIVSYFGGLQDPSLLIVFLESDETPEQFKSPLIDAFISMPHEKTLLESWLIQFYQKLKSSSPLSQPITFTKKMSDILHRIHDQNLVTLIPEFSFEFGISFPQISGFLNISNIELNHLLEQLANLGYLIREIQDCYYSCPDCDSAKFQMKSTCRVCNSNALERTLIIEHFMCGTQTIGKKFMTSNGMVCPKCNIQLKTEGIDHSTMGIFYYCHKCKNFFRNPAKFLLCHNCGGNIPEENANLTSIIGYKIHKENLNKFITAPKALNLEEANKYS